MKTFDHLLIQKAIQNAKENDSSIYIGQWSLDHKRHGYGIEISNNGSKYEGDWYNDNKTGFGRYINNKGCYYEGNK